VKLERRSELRVPVQQQGGPASTAALAALLADPQRVLQQLLSGEQLQAQADGLFLYTPRPLALPGVRLAPKVSFAAQWQEPLLLIQLVETQLPGLAALERKVRYRFSAELQAADGGVQVRAQATLELATGADGLGLPQPLLAFLGQRALGLIFGRLERRCHRNLPALVARSGPTSPA
jgi:hypothetical protein